MQENITKVCKKCRKALTYDQFYKRNSGRYWYSWCKKCWDSKTTAYNKTNNVRTRAGEKRRRIDRVSRGLCAKCDTPQLINTVLCEKHYLMRIGHDRVGRSTTEIAKLLKQKLEKQNFICPYTGVTLKLGLNSELDHILPTSKFPELSEDLDNTEWVLNTVNRMKHCLTKEDFIKLCRTIVEKAQ